MALYAIGDIHLSLGRDKPMDVFEGWQDYLEKLRKHWTDTVCDTDTVVLAGDICWAMRLEHCDEDFAFINALPGRKLVMKGNHDYWWNSRAKMERYTQDHNFLTLHFLHNNSFLADNVAVCGTRGWMYEPDVPQDLLVMAREEGRLRASLEYARGHWPKAERVVFLHYPPVYPGTRFEALISLLAEYDVRRCYYGHLHGPSIPRAVQGDLCGVKYTLISADALRFLPLKIAGNPTSDML